MTPHGERGSWRHTRSWAESWIGGGLCWQAVGSSHSRNLTRVPEHSLCCGGRQTSAPLMTQIVRTHFTSYHNNWETRPGKSKQLRGHMHTNHGHAAPSNLTRTGTRHLPTWARSISLRHYMHMPLLRNSELLLSDAVYLFFTSLKHWLLTFRKKISQFPIEANNS